MRRREDNWINATQILKVAGYDKPSRTRILEKEVHRSAHEKIQGGYGKYQGKSALAWNLPWGSFLISLFQVHGYHCLQVETLQSVTMFFTSSDLCSIMFRGMSVHLQRLSTLLQPPINQGCQNLL